MSRRKKSVSPSDSSVPERSARDSDEPIEEGADQTDQIDQADETDEVSPEEAALREMFAGTVFDTKLDFAKPDPNEPASTGAATAEPTYSASDMGGGENDELRVKLQEMTNRTLRAQAELENYRKRVMRQREEERRYAYMPLLRDLLPVWDNMGRAIEAAEKSDSANGPSTDDSGGLLEGFQMVVRQLEETLARHGCREIDAENQPFDPHLHAAISQTPSPDHEPGTVLHVTEVGFQLHDRVVRPSKVIVVQQPVDDSP